MKTIQSTAGIIMVMGLLAVVPAYAADVPQVVEDHQAAAASYEQRAAQQDALIAEHQQMKKDYKDRYFVNEKVTSQDKIRKMEEHCDAIIGDATKLKNELLNFAAWHRMQAAELQGL